MSKAYEEGYDHGRRCGKPGVMRDDSALSRSENPYPKDSQAYKDWDRGWDAANNGW